ncbi:Na+/H+ antiporter subunit E [uncultured Cohaesibacter sp.]|uniref:Na+/H+ antiporter subunit E n=1 Tax=uncultured Cohaesibacter sp. TaxID=1002546 RepID=UPI0029310623|nr:Na+/H+ antiporter subunit E [uncultured Cohaesibacter sp.]
MSKTYSEIKLFITLLVVWLLLNGSIAPQPIIVGVVVAGLLTILLRDPRKPSKMSLLSGYRFCPASILATIIFFLVFLKALVKANLQMAALVLSPKLPVKPAIVRIQTRLTNPVARLILANSITLTPGTLTVEMDGQWLYIHWVVAETTDLESASREIASDFEKYLEVMYG